MLAHPMLSCNHLLVDPSFSKQKKSREGAYSAKYVTRPEPAMLTLQPLLVAGIGAAAGLYYAKINGYLDGMLGGSSGGETQVG